MKISPFTPTIYSEGIGRVTSPPFDMLSKKDEETLASNPKNIINLKRCREPEEARLLFNRWMNDGTLKRYTDQSLVVMKQSFSVEGIPSERYGVIGLLDMRDAENCLIPHEDTIRRLVTERSKLIERMEYQTEPVFVVNDNDELVETLKEIMNRKICDRHYEEPPGVMNSICIISNKEDIERIQQSLSGSVGIIADGHHRTKSMVQLSLKYDKKVPFFNNIFVYITSINADSVLIGQVHRVITTTDETIPRLKDSFLLEETDKNSDPDLAVLHAGEKQYRLISKDNEDFFHYLKTIDVCISGTSRRGTTFYTSEITVALNKILGNPREIAIIMPPWKKSEFSTLVKQGKILPAKSTYFYPKIPSGIAFYG